MVEHKGLCNLVEAQKNAFGIGAESRVLQFASLSFDASVSEIFSTLGAGGSLHVYGRERLMPGIDLKSGLREEEITMVTLPPTVLAALEEADLPSLQTVIAAGEACTEEIVARWARRRRFLDAYGPTEATVCASIGECEPDDNRRPTIGRPIANTGLYILDPEGRPVPMGMRGELYISGAGLARGYWGRPTLTAERFIPNIFSREGGERLYRTGDLCRYFPDGNIEFVGRTDEQVKVRGYRIELGEIEAVLKEHRGVKQSVVVASDDEKGAKRLLGYVVGEEGTTPAELKRHVREILPEYMVPEAILILEEMPVTVSGKIDRKRLPLVKDSGRPWGQKFADARTPVEEILVGIFERVLKLDRIGAHDNFFEIGGHSLLAMQITSRVRSAFGVEIGVGSIFEEATPEGLARKIEEAIRAREEDQAPPLVRVPRKDRGEIRFPLSFAQQRLWFIDQLEQGSAAYSIPSAVRLEGKLDRGVFESVINEIIRRHEILRTRFEVEEGAPVQVIEEWKHQRLKVEDMTNLTEEEKEEEIRRIVKEEAGTGFDLNRGPLIRIRVIALDEDHSVVFFTMHHIVCDEWSMGLLVKEVCVLYEAMYEGRESPLPELEIQYGDYAYWQKQYLR
jgi:acyl carrier protein